MKNCATGFWISWKNGNGESAMNTETKKKPFKGLSYYEEEDRDIFFGRAREEKKLASLVELNPLTLVFGKSGIGKTSLLNAGFFLPVPFFT
jgi:putative ribosome biogenesis GTPase RsgA